MTVTLEADPRIAAVVQHLRALDDVRFRQEVDADLRQIRASDLRKMPESEQRSERTRYDLRRQALRTPELIDRWWMTLQMIAKSVEGQLASMQEDHEAEKATLRAEMAKCPTWAGTIPCCAEHAEAWETAKAEFARNRSGRLRFKTGLDEWLIEARALRDGLRGSMYDSIVAEERNHYAGVAKALKEAITQHRAEILDDDDPEPTEADKKLWACLT